MQGDIEVSGRVLNLTEAASFVRVSTKTLAQMARMGIVPARQVGREWRFLVSALEAWLGSAGAQRGALERQRELFGKPLNGPPGPNGLGFKDTAFTLNRQSPLHRWVPWIAGFSASFVDDILSREGQRRARPMTVLDPFAGVGTTLVQAMLSGHRSVGFEINPYAALAARLKVSCPLMNPRVLKRCLCKFTDFMDRSASSPDNTPLAEAPADFRGRVPFFSPKVERQVLFVIDFIDGCREKWIKDFLRLALGSVIVGFSNYSYEPSLGTRRGAAKPDITDAPVAAIVASKVAQMVADVEQVHQVVDAMAAVPRAAVYEESYLTTKRLKKHSAHLIVTSPPYLNNYHYIRNTRPQLFWLGLVSGREDLRVLERTSFGCFWQTVRSEHPINLDFKYPALEEVVERVRRQHMEKGPYGGPGWANYAAKYFNDCYRFCNVTRTVLRPGGTAVVVIGNNILQGIEVQTDRFFAGIAEQVGFQVVDLHRVRDKRTGSSIVNSSVRAGSSPTRVHLYETAVELRAPPSQ